MRPVFRHRSAADGQRGGLPPGFEWAASLTSDEPHEADAHLASASAPHGHDEGHATVRHHHAAGDPSVKAQPDSGDLDERAGGAGQSQGGTGVLAWATPQEGFRWIAAGSVRPTAGDATRWSDADPKLPERPPRTA
jgi:hypothetical protein